MGRSELTSPSSHVERRLRAALCSLLLLAVSRPVVGAEPPRPLRLVSFNLLHGGFALGGPGNGQLLEERLAGAVEALRALEVDVIGLQEASSGPTRGDVAGRLAAALGFHHARAAASYHWVGRLAFWVTGFDEGPAIVSRFPIVATDVLAVEPCDQWYDRVLLCAVLATPWGPLEACSTHTASSACQLRSVATLLRARRGTRPLVLMADLNSTPESAAVSGLVAEVGLVDTFPAANPDAPGFTVWQPVRAEQPAVRRRVDYVLVAPGAAGPVRVRTSQVRLNTPWRAADGHMLWPSDHYAVLSAVDLFRAEP